MLCRALSSFTEDDHQQEDKEGNMINRVIKAIRQNIVAWLALFVALSGTSMAASHYIITSTKQIKPSVLRQLRGAKGARGVKGATGAMGAAGAKGANGSQGPAGPTGATGSSGTNGKSITGKEGPDGPEGEKGETGEKGLTGEQGPPGSALAYARIKSDGEIVQAASKNFEHATVEIPEESPGKEEIGVYCISGLSGIEKHNVVATIDQSEAEFGAGLEAFLGVGVNTSCAPGTEITVETFAAEEQEEGAKYLDAGFYIAIN